MLSVPSGGVVGVRSRAIHLDGAQEIADETELGSVIVRLTSLHKAYGAGDITGKNQMGFAVLLFSRFC
jgi:hypothetical protein